MNRFKSAPAIDVHQHLLPAELVDALRRRTAPPRLDGWRLELAGEPAYDVSPADHDPDHRTAQAGEDELGLALVSLSSALGIESLAPDEARPLLDAWHHGALELPAPYRAWAAAGLRQIDPGDLARQLDRGLVGLQLPATALVTEAGYAHVAPLLDVLVGRDRPLFIHPGPVAAGTSATAPSWWPAIVDYVSQMHAAWFAFRVWGRPAFPTLRVCFALLAGLAPLHGERFAARAGERTVVDPETFLETSSYGTRAIDATVRALGIDVLVNGSDRPYARPVVPDLGDAALHALRTTNAVRLLNSEEVSDDLALAACAQS